MKPGPYKYARAFANNAPDYWVIHTGASAFTGPEIARTDSEENARGIAEALNARNPPPPANVYREALLTQGASNLGGLVHGWARVMTALQAQARAGGHGTDWLNTHPVNVLFAEQVHHLTGSSRGYGPAYIECADKAGAG